VDATALRHVPKLSAGVLARPSDFGFRIALISALRRLLIYLPDVCLKSGGVLL